MNNITKNTVEIIGGTAMLSVFIGLFLILATYSLIFGEDMLDKGDFKFDKTGGKHLN